MSRAPLTSETRVLLRAAQPDATAAGLEPALRDPDFDWDLLMAIAHSEKATNGLSQMLRKLPPGTLPGERVTQLSRLTLISSFRMQHLEQQLAGILRTLANAGIEVVLLKGAALAATCYHSFAARPMSDLDLLVRTADARRAWQIMRDHGWSDQKYQEQKDFYQNHNHLPPLDDPTGTGLGLEIHTEITPACDAIRLSAETIWQRAQPIELHGVRTYVPALVDQILHLAIHFAWSHNLDSTAWRTFRDLHQLATTNNIDWAALVHEAGQTQTRTCCYWTLALAHSLAAFPVDHSVLQALRPPRSRIMLNLLERHFVTELFPANRAACPSDSVHEYMWSLAIAPNWSGHGSARPWSRATAWGKAIGAPTRTSIRQRLSSHVRRTREWSRYLRALFFSGRLYSYTGWLLANAIVKAASLLGFSRPSVRPLILE